MKPRDLLLLVVICAVWASNNVLSKVLVSDWQVPPLFYTAVRFLIVVACTLPWLRPIPKPLWRIVVIGLAMGGGSFGLNTGSPRAAGPRDGPRCPAGSARDLMAWPHRADASRDRCKLRKTIDHNCQIQISS